MTFKCYTINIKEYKININIEILYRKNILKKLKNRTFIELLNFKNGKVTLILQYMWSKILFKVHINQKSSKNQ